MAGTKRRYNDDDEDAYSPTKHCRAAPMAQADNLSNSTKSVRGNITEKSHLVRQEKVVIDLSDDEGNHIGENLITSGADTKHFSAPSITSDFPRNTGRRVQIIIDPQHRYYLHQDVLSRVSPMFAKQLKTMNPEFRESLKTAAISAEFCFILIFSEEHEKWIFRKFRHALLIVWKGVTRKLSEPCASTDLNHVPKAEANNCGTILAFSNLINNITNSHVTKDEEEIVRERSANHVSVGSNGTETPSNVNPVAVHTQCDEKQNRYNKLSSFQSGDDGYVSLSRKHSQLDVYVTTDQVQSSLLGISSDQPVADTLTSGAVEIAKSDQQSMAQILSSVGIETPASKTTDELQSANYKTEAAELELTSIGQNKSTSDVMESEGGSTNRLNDEASFINTSIPSLDVFQSSAEIDTVNVRDDLGLIQEKERSSKVESVSSLHIAQPSTNKDVDNLTCCGAVNGPTNPDILIGPPIELCEAYKNLFLIFDGKPPAISTESIYTALEQCENIITISNYLQTIPIIRSHLTSAISRFSTQIYLAIAAEPLRWLKVSMALESAAMFKQCIIHIVGIYTPGLDGQVNLPVDLSNTVQELILYKVRQIDQQRMDVNERLCASYIMVNSQAVMLLGPDTSCLYTWLVNQIWRDWFCRQLANVVHNPHQTGQLYRIIERSGDAYLPLPEVIAIIEKITDPVKIEPDVIQEDLSLMKDFARKAVRELCRNNSIADIEEAGIRYLTCTRIFDEELPWYESEQRCRMIGSAGETASNQ